MARELATIRGSTFAAQMIDEQRLLREMIEDIVCGAVEADTDGSGLLRNYLNDATWWGEVAGTALLTATIFRMAVMVPDVFGAIKYIDWASRKVEVVGHHIDETGTVAPVVNALNEGQAKPLQGVNPEGQAFVVLMHTAWRDWKM